MFYMLPKKVEGRVAIHSPYERKPNKGGQMANKQIKNRDDQYSRVIIGLFVTVKLPT